MGIFGENSKFSKNNLKYNEFVLNAYKKRAVGRNLLLREWIAEGYANHITPIFDYIIVHIDTGTEHVRFKLNPNKKDWYLRLRRDVSRAMGVSNVTLHYGGFELDKYSLDQISELPRYTITVERRDDLGEIKDLDIPEDKTKAQQDADQIDRVSKMLIEILSKTLSEMTKTMSNKDAILTVTDQNVLLPTIAAVLQNPLVYDSTDPTSYQKFMEKFGIDMNKLCNDTTQKVMACLCKGPLGKRKKRHYKKRTYTNIGDEISNSKGIENMSKEDFEDTLIGANIFCSLKNCWNKLWHCKSTKTCPSSKCKDYRSDHSSSSCTSECGNTSSSESDSCGYSSDDYPNKYTRSGSLSIVNPVTKYWSNETSIDGRYCGQQSPTSSCSSSESSCDESPLVYEAEICKPSPKLSYCGDSINNNTFVDDEDDQFSENDMDFVKDDELSENDMDFVKDDELSENDMDFVKDDELSENDMDFVKEDDTDDEDFYTNYNQNDLNFLDYAGNENDEEEEEDYDAGEDEEEYNNEKSSFIETNFSSDPEPKIVKSKRSLRAPKAIPISEEMNTCIQSEYLDDNNDYNEIPDAIPINNQSFFDAESDDSDLPDAIPIYNSETRYGDNYQEMDENDYQEENDLMPHAIPIESVYNTNENFDLPRIVTPDQNNALFESSDEEGDEDYNDMPNSLAIGDEMPQPNNQYSSITFDSIKTEASNFLSLYKAASGHKYNPNEFYNVMVPTNNTLNNAITTNLKSAGQKSAKKFIESYIAKSSENNNFNKQDNSGFIHMSTIGNRIFSYNPTEKKVRGIKEDFNVHGEALHPKFSNVKFILQDGLHNRMKTA